MSLMALYFVAYVAARNCGAIRNVNYFMNNYGVDNVGIAILAAPGCIVENIITYSTNFGFRGTLAAFCGVNIIVSKDFGSNEKMIVLPSNNGAN